MNISDVGKAVIKLGAPLLGTVLGGSAGGTIGQLVANAFGGDINDPDDLVKLITTDPQASVKLAEIQSNTKLELQKIIALQAENEMKYQNQAAEISLKNTMDARQNNTASKSMFPEVISMLIIIGFFLCVYWVAAYPQDTADHDILNILLGVIGSAFSGVVNYWLGSSMDKRR